MADKKQLYKDQYGQRYATPSQPSFDTMQKVGIPNYVEVPTNDNDYSYEGSHVRSGSPEKVRFSKYQAENVIGPSSPGVSKKDVKERILAHELQHQLGWMPRQKGQVGSMEESKWVSPIDEGWSNNAKELGFSPRGSWKYLAESINKPEIQKRLKELNWPSESRLRDNPKEQALTELLADLNALETNNKIDITKDPVFKKHVFDDPRMSKLYKSTTGLSGVVIGDSDYKPYSLEAQEAWHGRDPSISDRIKNMIGYRQGGLTAVAQHLESKGRGNDHMLVHMTPREVAGLQALAKAHGGSLTVNPDTGLVEAGWLDSILPMVAGAGLMMIPGMQPAAAAMLVGAGTGLATGSVEKGLMAGLGAYGGAGIGESLANAGGSSIAEAGGADAVNKATSQGLASMPEGYNAANAGLTQNQMLSGSQDMSKFINAEQFPNLNAEQLQAYKDTMQSGVYNPQDIVRTAGAQNATTTTTPWQNLKTGAKETFGSLDNTGKFIGQNYGKIGMAAAPAVADALTPKPIDPNAGKQTLDEKYRKYPYAYELASNFQGYTPTPPNPAYRPAGLGYSGYAVGGVIPDAMAPGGLAALQGMRDGYGASQTATGDEVQFNGGGRTTQNKKRATYTSASKLAAMDPYQSGISELNNARYAANMSGDFSIPTRIQELGDIPLRAARGTYLKGAGDGMSDSIPATINGTQPARLADGEFVVPADVVSHIGNGSSDAGAKKLYKMMDKVRMARTGKKSQAPAVKTDKYMPA